MRTTIDIDDELMKLAMKATNSATKKAAVEAALCKIIELRKRENSQMVQQAEVER